MSVAGAEKEVAADDRSTSSQSQSPNFQIFFPNPNSVLNPSV